MPRTMRLSALAVTALLSVAAATGVSAQQQPMTFFITSVGKGNGADLGGLDGADTHCAALAKAAGSTITGWRAYLSTTVPAGDEGVNARDRIGKGPWHNAKGVLIAKGVADLHSDEVSLNKQTALTEKGEVVTGSGRLPTCTIFSPAPTPTAATRRQAAIPPAATGPRAPKARPLSATTTASG